MALQIYARPVNQWDSEHLMWKKNVTFNSVPPQPDAFMTRYSCVGLNHLVGNKAISHEWSVIKRSVKTQATVRCLRTSHAPHPHTFGNTKFEAKLRCHSSRLRSMKIIDAAKAKLRVIRKVGGGWGQGGGGACAWQVVWCHPSADQVCSGFDGDAYFERWEHVGGLQAEGAQENRGRRVGGVQPLHEVHGSHHGQVVPLTLRFIF